MSDELSSQYQRNRFPKQTLHTNSNSNNSNVGPLFILHKISLFRSLEADLSILADKSKYFEDCVSFAEKGITFDSKIVPFFALENLVQHCCDCESHYFLQAKPEEFEQLIVAADYLQMEHAMKVLCERFSYTIPSRLSGSGDQLPKATIHMWLRLYNIIGKQKGFDETKMNWFGERMARQLKRVLHEVHFFKLDEDRLYDLMSSSHLRLTEEEVLKTIKAWINYDYEERKTSFGRLARCIRPHPDLTV